MTQRICFFLSIPVVSYVRNKSQQSYEQSCKSLGGISDCLPSKQYNCLEKCLVALCPALASYWLQPGACTTVFICRVCDKGLAESQGCSYIANAHIPVLRFPVCASSRQPMVEPRPRAGFLGDGSECPSGPCPLLLGTRGAGGTRVVVQWAQLIAQVSPRKDRDILDITGGSSTCWSFQDCCL